MPGEQHAGPPRRSDGSGLGVAFCLRWTALMWLGGSFCLHGWAFRARAQRFENFKILEVLGVLKMMRFKRFGAGIDVA